MTPLQQEIRNFEIAHNKRAEAAMKDCKTHGQRKQCFEAYANLYTAEVDVIQQRHGLPGTPYLDMCT